MALTLDLYSGANYVQLLQGYNSIRLDYFWKEEKNASPAYQENSWETYDLGRRMPSHTPDSYQKQGEQVIMRL